MATSNHPYQSCRDRDCEQPYCQIWREARAEGYEHGHEDGYETGYGDGYAAAAAAAARSTP
jgi:flagellar biosynthesis/type III secretory pathway protein FliH